MNTQLAGWRKYIILRDKYVVTE